MLSRLVLKNFRNYRDYEADFGPGLNLIVGDNGVGKTNLLEAVFLLLEGRSFRTAGPGEMISHGEEEGFVEGRFDGGGGRQVKVVLSKEGETVKKTRAETRAISFVPEDVFLVKGNPEWRRRFIDQLLRSLKPHYGELIREYGHVLRQRNQALKMVRRELWKKEDIRNWNLLLVRRGMEIVRERREALQLLEKGLNREVMEWGMGKVEIKYYSNMASEDERENLDRLERMEEAELRKGTTLLGPHRDEMIFLLGGRNLRREGSQGEQKVFCLAGKMTQADIIREHTGKKIILLMDDCYSELDEVNRRRISASLRRWEQVLATSTERVEGVEADRVIEIGRQGVGSNG